MTTTSADIVESSRPTNATIARRTSSTTGSSVLASSHHMHMPNHSGPAVFAAWHRVFSIHRFLELGAVFALRASPAMKSPLLAAVPQQQTVLNTAAHMKNTQVLYFDNTDLSKLFRDYLAILDDASLMLRGLLDEPSSSSAGVL